MQQADRGKSNNTTTTSNNSNTAQRATLRQAMTKQAATAKPFSLLRTRNKGH